MPLTVITATTFPEAINTMLEYIGEEPIPLTGWFATLDESVDPNGLTDNTDVIAAHDILVKTSRRIQEDGYSWNILKQQRIEPTVLGVPTIPGNLVVPLSTLRIIAVGNSSVRCSQKIFILQGNSIYELSKDTDTFDQAYDFDLVVGLAFNDLHSAAKHYIMLTAASEFQKRRLGSETLYSINRDQLIEAKISFDRLDADIGQYNFFRGNHFAHLQFDRGCYYYGKGCS